MMYISPLPHWDLAVIDHDFQRDSGRCTRSLLDPEPLSSESRITTWTPNITASDQVIYRLQLSVPGVDCFLFSLIFNAVQKHAILFSFHSDHIAFHI